MRQTRSPRIVTVCVLGRRARQVSSNLLRVRLMADVTAEILNRPGWKNLDAIIYPGAYFRLPKMIGHLSDRDRAAAIEDQRFGLSAMADAELLECHSPGVLVIFGADSADPRRLEYGDQFAVAVNSQKVVGIARKVFPTENDTNCLRPYIPSVADYTSGFRYVGLANGSRASLNSCFDLYALIPGADGLPRGTSAIRDLWMNGRLVAVEDSGFAKMRRTVVDQWLSLHAANPVDVAIATIHGFNQPGNDAYWQRHGVCAASAAINGGLAIGAAHYVHALPRPRSQITLASWNVPDSMVTAGERRPCFGLQPTDQFIIKSGSRLTALVRFFTLGEPLELYEPLTPRPRKRRAR